MPREASAGGVVIRENAGSWEVAVIRPHGRNLWALPKGHVDPGETPEQTAAREVREETGLTATLMASLGEIRYVYQFRGQRIFKRVHFYLFRYQAGELGVLPPGPRVEVDEVRWVPLAQLVPVLGYKGEKSIAARAVRLLRAGDSTPPGGLPEGSRG
ncbi:NUDIX hydrolase [Hyalangium gracile]|uniref:NUDIX hydrolase n=1 Tax=Hyalangium gracile TaxID=394092 RepID=UPI001CCB3174|nr:NUDIX hydrolase [Hyalangium gracile]